MKKTIEELLSGNFRHEHPQLLFSQDKIEVTLKAGDVYKGELYFGTEDNQKIRGYITSSNRRVVPGTEKFSGTTVRLQYGIDGAGMHPGERHEGWLCFTTDIGEYKLPFLVQAEKTELKSVAGEVPDMDTNQRVIDYIRDVAEYIPTRDGKISATMMLERFLFDSAMQYAPIAKLSGGEKRRLYLLKVLMEAPNVLLLDEPSNDLDIPTLTILEDYLDSFAGIVIAVSHDRYFLDNIVDRIFAFEGNGHLTQYEGGYTDYTEALARKGGAVSEGQSTAVGAEKKKSAQADWKQNRPQKLKFTYKEQREFETIDDDIAALEELLEKLDKDMEANATNSVKLREIMEQKEKAQADLDEKMDRWVYLNDLAERIEAQKSEK